MMRFAFALALTVVACAPEPAVTDALLFDDGALESFEQNAYARAISARPDVNGEQQDVVERIVGDPAGFLDRRPPPEVLNEAELVFFAAGRIFEMLHFYADAVDRGVEELRPRKAWLLQRVGLHQEALVEARIAVQRTPESADAHFVLGYVLGQSDEADTALLREVRGAYQATVTLDPAYVGPSDVRVADILEQVRSLDAALR